MARPSARASQRYYWTRVTAVAVAPSENVAVRLSVTPRANSMPAQSEAKSTNEPPSGTTKSTAIVDGSLMSGQPSSDVATPNTQKGLLASVSQIPGPVL